MNSRPGQGDPIRVRMASTSTPSKAKVSTTKKPKSSSRPRSKRGQIQPMFPSGKTASRDLSSERWTRDEFILNVEGSDPFKTTPFFVNPGLPETFPWLSTLAAKFEKYTFEQLEFYYKPLVSAFANGGQRGKVMLSFDYDATDPSPSSKIEVEDTQPHDDCMPYQTCRLRIPDTRLQQLYVRTEAPPYGSDLKTYDIGKLSVSTEGQVVDSGKVGELRVRYVVRLDVPILESKVAVPPNMSTQCLGSELTPMIWDDAEHDVPFVSVETKFTNPWKLKTDVDDLTLATPVSALTVPRGIWQWNYQVTAEVGTSLTIHDINITPVWSNSSLTPTSLTRQMTYASNNESSPFVLIGTSQIVLSGSLVVPSDGNTAVSLRAEGNVYGSATAGSVSALHTFTLIG